MSVEFNGTPKGHKKRKSPPLDESIILETAEYCGISPKTSRALLQDGPPVRRCKPRWGDMSDAQKVEAIKTAYDDTYKDFLTADDVEQATKDLPTAQRRTAGELLRWAEMDLINHAWTCRFCRTSRRAAFRQWMLVFDPKDACLPIKEIITKLAAKKGKLVCEDWSDTRHGIAQELEEEFEECVSLGWLDNRVEELKRTDKSFTGWIVGYCTELSPKKHRCIDEVRFLSPKDKETLFASRTKNATPNPTPDPKRFIRIRKGSRPFPPGIRGIERINRWPVFRHCKAHLLPPLGNSKLEPSHKCEESVLVRRGDKTLKQECLVHYYAIDDLRKINRWLFKEIAKAKAGRFGADGKPDPKGDQVAITRLVKMLGRGVEELIRSGKLATKTCSMSPVPGAMPMGERDKIKTASLKRARKLIAKRKKRRRGWSNPAYNNSFWEYFARMLSQEDLVALREKPEIYFTDINDELLSDAQWRRFRQWDDAYPQAKKRKLSRNLSHFKSRAFGTLQRCHRAIRESMKPTPSAVPAIENGRLPAGVTNGHAAGGEGNAAAATNGGTAHFVTPSAATTAIGNGQSLPAKPVKSRRGVKPATPEKQTQQLGIVAEWKLKIRTWREGDRTTPRPRRDDFAKEKGMLPTEFNSLVECVDERRRRSLRREKANRNSSQ